jgi:hypothetical protein
MSAKCSKLPGMEDMRTCLAACTQVPLAWARSHLALSRRCRA